MIFLAVYLATVIFWAGFVVGSWREQVAPFWALVGCFAWPFVFTVVYGQAALHRHKIRRWNSWTQEERHAYNAEHGGPLV